MLIGQQIVIDKSLHQTISEATQIQEFVQMLQTLQHVTTCFYNDQILNLQICMSALLGQTLINK